MDAKLTLDRRGPKRYLKYNNLCFFGHFCNCYFFVSFPEMVDYDLLFDDYDDSIDEQKQLERFYYQTEAYAGEYDIPKCGEGTPPEDCIHSITAHFQGKDMVDDNIIGNNKGFKLIYLARI